MSLRNITFLKHNYNYSVTRTNLFVFLVKVEKSFSLLVVVENPLWMHANGNAFFVATLFAALQFIFLQLASVV